ncbi:unnamed protein product, partial [marine sediment metagenome]
FTYKSEDKDEFTEHGDIWEALNAGFQVTLDDRGMILDIWDPATGDTLNFYGFKIGTRSDPYPSDNNITNLKAQYEKLLKEIAELRREARQTRGAAKSKIHSSIASKLREYGTILFQYGRLIRRRRRNNKNEERKRIKGPKPVETE